MGIKKFLLVMLIAVPSVLGATSLYSPTWGFSLDLPPDYEYTGGDGRDRFSFMNPDGAFLDIVVYAAEDGETAPYASVRALALDVQQRIRSTGDTSYFEYRYKEAAILELIFPDPSGSGYNGSSFMIGWGLALELAEKEPDKPGPLLIALSYSDSNRPNLQILHLSVLDSIAPGQADKKYPGPVTEFSYPRETRVQMPVWGLGENAWFYAEDEEASQALIDREFNILTRYAGSDMWEDAWKRYYRAIYRDSFDRLKDIAFLVENRMNSPSTEPGVFAGRVLDWIQRFTYERDFNGADFINLISAVRDGRGDCDNKAMLWALILNQANIQAAMMVSAEYSHAMGLVNIPGPGARFDMAGIQWLVAETTANVGLGFISQDVSNADYWLGIILE